LKELKAYKNKTQKAELVEENIKALNNSDKDVRADAAKDLGELGDENAIESLLKLLADTDATVRQSVRKALKKLKFYIDETKEKQLVDAELKLIADSDASVRQSAREA